MDALLGKVVSVTRRAEAAADALAEFEVKFKPACVLPRRTPVPAWLADQTMSVARKVGDVREIGGMGDSLSFTPEESVRWLAPLSVEPAVAYGTLPEVFTLHLAWWKDATPPEALATSNGRRVSVTWESGKDAGSFVARVMTKELFPTTPALPVQVEVTFDKLRSGAVVVPDKVPSQVKLIDPRGDIIRVESPWYSVDFLVSDCGGGIASLVERGRKVDHFAPVTNRIYPPLDYGGHTDRIKIGRGNKSGETRMTCTERRHDGDASLVVLEGVVDEGKNIRTSVVYRVCDNLPLLCLQRRVSILEGKKEEENKKPVEPIDKVSTMMIDFRGSWRTHEENGLEGSRVITVDGDRLAIVRSTQPMDMAVYDGWALKQGWGLIEHPLRREAMLYLMKRSNPPQFACYHSTELMTFEPMWPPFPATPGSGASFSIAMSAGEAWGASVEGAWVACLAPSQQNKDRTTLAIVARLSDSLAANLQKIILQQGSIEQTADLKPMTLPGVGIIHYAVLESPTSSLAHPLNLTVAGIAARSVK